jgi:redox-sensitive bicupin YhaK (pirin superfamily)
MTQTFRTLERRVRGQATTDGAGVKLTRVLTQDLQQRLDPFLMLDHFASDDPNDYIAGFPNHPHRGFETVTYMVAGRMRHRDSAGNEGLLQNGGVQWMTAGRGLVHSELPEQESGVMEGFQLWLNLPGRDKMCAPSYRDIPSADIPEVRSPDGLVVRVIAGAFLDLPGAVHRSAKVFPTQALYLDLNFAATGGVLELPLPAQHHALVYVYRGSLRVGGDTLAAPLMGILAQDGAAIRLEGLACGDGSSEPCRALLIAGQPLQEPIAQYGPFVMNTRAELMQAVEDFQGGRLG